MLELTTMKDNEMAFLIIINIIYLLGPLYVFINYTLDENSTSEFINSTLFLYSPLIFSIISLFLYIIFKNKIFRILLNAINLIILNIVWVFILGLNFFCLLMEGYKEFHT